jgi:hypothetical protein
LASKYRVKPPKQLKSQFLLRQEAKLAAAKTKQEKELNAIQSEALADAKKTEEEEEDELKGLRIHSWVLILPGKRDIAEAFFIGGSYVVMEFNWNLMGCKNRTINRGRLPNRSRILSRCRICLQLFQLLGQHASLLRWPKRNLF